MALNSIDFAKSAWSTNWTRFRPLLTMSTDMHMHCFLEFLQKHAPSRINSVFIGVGRKLKNNIFSNKTEKAVSLRNNLD